MISKLLPIFILLPFALAMAQQVPSLPYQPSVITDAKGHEWLIEQNGALQRNGGAASMIGNAMMMHFGGQQFYSQQPLISPDGKEILISAQQPYQGISISRRITVLEREGALRYVEEFFNTTSRDVTLTVELRHGLNSTARDLMSDLGRVIGETLEAKEAGLVALPADAERGAPILYFSFRAPKSVLPLRVRVQNKYQISIFLTLTIQAGQRQSLAHSISQLALSDAATPQQVMRACAPLAISRLVRGLPKSVLKQVANLGQGLGAFGVVEWFPPEFWGITPAVSDQLALGKDSLLKGRVALTKVVLAREGVRLTPEQSQVAAMAGPLFTGEARSWLWLRDGQRLLGNLEASEMKFSLLGGAELPVTKLDRLVLSKPVETPVVLGHPLIELLNGERLCIQPTGDLQANTAWGEIAVPWAEVIAWKKAERDALGGLLCLRDGSCLRALPKFGKTRLRTLSLGELELDLAELSQLITPLAQTMTGIDADPTTSFLDLEGGQRLVARITSANLTFLTEVGPLSLSPGSLRELRDVTEDESQPVRVFEADLWGGGVVKGTLEDLRVRVEGRGVAWQIPTQHLRRLVNPVPVADHGLMRRIGQLIQDLGHEQWKARAAASAELKELGPLARGSLQEALKSATDAEVTRRLEELLQAPE